MATVRPIPVPRTAPAPACASMTLQRHALRVSFASWRARRRFGARSGLSRCDDGGPATHGGSFMRSALIAALILTSTVPSASAQDAARHRRYRIVVDEARGLSSAEAGWALTWATDRLNGRCARPGPASER